MNPMFTRVAFALLLATAILTHTRLIGALHFDGENSLTEGETLYAVDSVREGRPLYHDFRRTPHVLTQYTPLFYLVPGKIAGWMGVNTMSAFTVGRVYAYGLWIGAAWLIYALARQLDCGFMPAAAAALVFLCAPLTTTWENSYRPDSAAVFFALFAMLMWLRGKWLPTALLLALAFLHKQSAVVAPAVIVLEELRARRWTRAALIAGTWAVVVGAVLWWSQRSSHGALVMNCFGSLAQLHDWRWPLYLFGAATVLGAPAFAGGWMALRLELPAVLKRYFVLALAFAFLSSAKFGSWTNYYIEPFAVGCVLSAVWLTRRQNTFLLPLIWFALAVVLSADATIGEWRRVRPTTGYGATIAALRSMGEPLFIEDVYVAARCGGEPFMLNPSIFAHLERAGRFDSAPIRLAIERREFARILGSRPLEDVSLPRPFPPAWLELMRRHYTLAGSLDAPGGTLWIYRPKP